jgi:SAM-dependent methyltransferase
MYSSRDVRILDSVTQVHRGGHTVVLAASHGGEYAGHRAADLGARGVILHDAGVGKDGAGIGSLPALDDRGIAGATVGHDSARIGNGLDCARNGVISAVNRAAANRGCSTGEPALACALAMHRDARDDEGRDAEVDADTADEGSTGREDGSVTGLDMTPEQLEKARQLRDEAGLDAVSFEHGYIEDLPFEDDTFDVVVSNGVINLSSETNRVFEEAARVLAPGGRLALSDIISETQMLDSIKTDADLWAVCIGGAMRIDDYTDLIEAAGFDVAEVRENPQYEFTSEQARGACRKYGVKNISLAARKE